jgi:diguanylate cyclase (GGDEF)-like protein
MAEYSSLPLEPPELASKQVETSRRQIDSRQWWLWTSAMTVTTLLAIGMASFALPAALTGPMNLSAFLVNDAVRGLLGLVLIFNAYVVFEQLQIHRIRREMADQLYALAVLDPLTGLFNRRYIQHRLEAEVSRCQRNRTQLTVILFDLDDFKQVNDRLGHEAGDCCLQAFGEHLKKATRGSDVAGRWGGDEFLALLPECKAEEVQYVMKRLFGLDAGVNGESLPVRFSAGWTDYVPGESITIFLKRADMALYANKHRPGKSTTPGGKVTRDPIAPEFSRRSPE